jgi:hypothetical protein
VGIDRAGQFNKGVFGLARRSRQSSSHSKRLNPIFVTQCCRGLTQPLRESWIGRHFGGGLGNLGNAADRVRCDRVCGISEIAISR